MNFFILHPRKPAYQEAKEEGLKEGIEKERSSTLMKISAKKMSAAEIAGILELDLEVVRQVMANGETK